MFSVFGKKPVDAISLPDVPYSVRLNCKDGGIFVGGKEPQHRRSNPDDKIDISIIKVSKYYGNLGLQYTGQWIQLFFVAAPNIESSTAFNFSFVIPFASYVNGNGSTSGKKSKPLVVVKCIAITTREGPRLIVVVDGVAIAIQVLTDDGGAAVVAGIWKSGRWTLGKNRSRMM